MPEKPSSGTHRDFVRYSRNRFPGTRESGSFVEKSALKEASIDQETNLTPEQLKEIKDNDYWTPLCDKILPETEKGVTQDEIINSLKHEKLPGGFSFEEFVEYIEQDDLNEPDDFIIS